MASGDNHQPWAYSHFTQPGQPAGQTGNFMNQGFGQGDNENDISTNAFSIPQQWQSQDNHFIHDNSFSSFQPQSSSFSVQQQFPGNNAPVQSHQHPQSYTAPISMDGPSDMSWDYDFSFDSNPLTNIGDAGISYGNGNGLQQASGANGMPSASSFPQGMSNTIPGQQRFGTGPPSGNMYTPNQVTGYGRNTPQAAPQALGQPVGQRQIMDYQQPAMNQQQPQPKQHHQPAPQHQHPQPQHQHAPPQHQPTPVQHQHPLPQHQHSQGQHQQPNPLNAASHQQSQLHQNSIGHAQQPPRIGTPQSIDPTPQPRQPAFNGRNVPPFPMQQQAQHIPNPDGRNSPAIPFSAPQQSHVQPPNVAKASPSLSNTQTTQSRFVPQQLMAMQRPSQSPVPPPNNATMPNIVQKPDIQHQSTQPGAQPKTNAQIASAALNQQPVARGLAPPRILHEDRNCPMGSRHVAFSGAQILPVGDDAEANNTIGEIVDPSQVPAQSLGRFLMPGPSGQARTLAFEALRHWTRAVEQEDVASQNEWEQRLKKYLGKFDYVPTVEMVTG